VPFSKNLPGGESLLPQGRWARFGQIFKENKSFAGEKKKHAPSWALTLHLEISKIPCPSSSSF
jgi:hypothetical protein